MAKATLEHDHTPSAIRERLSVDPKPTYVRDFVYGGIDGAITTFAIVAGVEGAALSQRTIIILGLANLLADGLSMAASNYTGTRTEVDDYRRLEAIEHKHISAAPEGEKEEVRQILERKGFTDTSLNDAVLAITGDKDRWVKFMLTEEYGVSHTLRAPMRAGFSTLLAFVLCGLIPLIPFLIGMANPFLLSIMLTGIVFFAIGSAKSRWSVSPWWQSGLETFLIGALAASAAYWTGVTLKALI